MFCDFIEILFEFDEGMQPQGKGNVKCGCYVHHPLPCVIQSRKHMQCYYTIVDTRYVTAAIQISLTSSTIALQLLQPSRRKSAVQQMQTQQSPWRCLQNEVPYYLNNNQFTSLLFPLLNYSTCTNSHSNDSYTVLYIVYSNSNLLCVTYQLHVCQDQMLHSCKSRSMARHLLQNYSLQWAIAILKPTRFFTESTRFFFAQPSRFFH